MGQKLRNRRLELGLLQKDVAKEFEVSEDTIVNWEQERVIPTVRHMPKIIAFLGHFPLEIDTSTIGGKLKMYRYMNGLSQKELAKKAKIDTSTIYHYELGKHTPNSAVINKLKEIFRQR